MHIKLFFSILLLHFEYHIELEFFCSECRTQWAEKVQHGSSSIDSKTSFFDNFAAASTAAANTDSSITFFMCIWRNNVQLRKAHIIRQLQHEHTTINTKFNRNNEKVTDIPDWKPITWRLSFSYEFVPEKWRFRCRYTKYMIIKAFHYFGK